MIYHGRVFRYRLNWSRSVFLGLMIPFASATATATVISASQAIDPDARSEAQSGAWTRLGVIVTSNQGLDGDRPLRFAYDDGERMSKVLHSLGQLETGNLYVFKSENPGELRRHLKLVGDKIRNLKSSGRKVFLQFYYSGHGASRQFHLGGERLHFAEVKRLLRSDDAEARVFVLDVCYGASFFGAKGFKTTAPLQLHLEVDKAASGEVTITSSAADEQAYETKSLGGSIFTSHWIMALRGAGDRNRDGQVSLFEAYSYAYDNTVSFAAENLRRPQHPSYKMELTGNRDMTLSRPVRSPSGLLFSGYPAGIFELRDINRGFSLGEVRLPGKGDFSLALEPGTFEVLHRPGQGPARAAVVEVRPEGLTPLEFGRFSAVAPGRAASKGGIVDSQGQGEYGEDGEEKQVVPEGAHGAASGNAEANAMEAGGGTDTESAAHERGHESESGIGEAPPQRLSPANPTSSTISTSSPKPPVAATSGRSPGLFGGALSNFFHVEAQAGLSTISDPSLRKAITKPGATEEHFGLSGSHDMQSLGQDYSVAMGFAPLTGWLVGLRLGAARRHHSRSAMGAEKMVGTDSSYSVRLRSEYSLSPLLVGGFVRAPLPGTLSSAWQAEMGMRWVALEAETRWTLERTLYGSSTEENHIWHGVGYRLEASLLRSRLLPQPLRARGWDAALRVGGHFQRLDQAKDEDFVLELDSKEWGTSVSLVLGVNL